MSRTTSRKLTHATFAWRLGERASTLRDLVRLFARSGRWWLIPLVAVLGTTALLLVVVHVIEYVAPFVYTIF